MPWPLFSAKPPKPKPTKYLIHDKPIKRVFVVDKDYATTGEREGWLTYSGYYELNGVMHFTFDYRG